MPHDDRGNTGHWSCGNCARDERRDLTAVHRGGEKRTAAPLRSATDFEKGRRKGEVCEEPKGAACSIHEYLVLEWQI